MKKFTQSLLTKVMPMMAMLSVSPLAFADAIAGEVEKQPLNLAAIGMFVLFVLGTLGITFWASKQNQTASDFYTAGGGISGFKNGLAIAGDFMSIASFGYFCDGVHQRL